MIELVLETSLHTQLVLVLEVALLSMGTMVVTFQGNKAYVFDI